MFWFTGRCCGILLLALTLCAAQSGPYRLSTAGEPPPDFHGKVRAVTGRTLLIDTAGEQTLEFRCSRKTKFYDGDRQLKASSLKPGDRVSVEAWQGIDGALNAVDVRLEHTGT